MQKYQRIAFFLFEQGSLKGVKLVKFLVSDVV